MSPHAELPPAQFDILMAVALTWTLGVAVVSALYRRSRGKPIFPKAPAHSVFVDRAGSGRSFKTAWTRFGGANSCLIVAVTPDALFYAPWFPFSLMFLPEFYDLEGCIPFTAILGIEPRQGLVQRSVRIAFRGADGGEGLIELRTRDPDAFLAALARDRRLASLIGRR